MPETPTAGRSRLAAKLAGVALPVRRAASRVALVYEERHFRQLAVTGLYDALAAQSARVGEAMRGLEERVILRVDILMEELWRRTESVGARQATELQRLAARLQEVATRTGSQDAELAGLARQMAEVHQLASEMAELRLLSAPAAPAPVPAHPAVPGLLRAELERGIRPTARERWEPLLKHLHGLSPVVTLGCGGGEFLALAQDAGVAAYAVDADPAAVANAQAGGFDARLDPPLAHLHCLADNSLGGAFLSLVTHPVSTEALDGLLAELVRVLRPDGAAVIESANPASFASFLQSSAAPPASVPTALPPSVFADRAQLAGLEVDECRYAPLPARHLAGVHADLADPALREIAAGVNELVGQLNDVLYGPQDYVLVLRKP